MILRDENNMTAERTVFGLRRRSSNSAYERIEQTVTQQQRADRGPCKGRNTNESGDRSKISHWLKSWAQHVSHKINLPNVPLATLPQRLKVANLTDVGLGKGGFERFQDLLVAMANDIALGKPATTQTAAMTVPNLKTLRAQAGEQYASEKTRLAWRQTKDWQRSGEPSGRHYLNYWTHAEKEAA
jgi:hypothetical protein